MPKSSLDRSSWGSIGSLAVRTFNVWQVTVALDRTLNDEAYHSTGNERLLKEKEGFLHLLIGSRPKRNNQLIGTLAR